MRTGDSPSAAELDPLLAEILAALEAAGSSRTKFGFRVAGDPTLVRKMEQGRHIKKPELRAAIKSEINALWGRVAAAEALD